MGGYTPKCYRCKYRRDIPSSCYSSCHHPGNETGPSDIGSEQNLFQAMQLNINAIQHGVRMGWFMWPVSFDPVWLTSCDGFSPISEKDG